jgi:hypothetical protein
VSGWRNLNPRPSVPSMIRRHPSARHCSSGAAARAPTITTSPDDVALPGAASSSVKCGKRSEQLSGETRRRRYRNGRRRRSRGSYRTRRRGRCHSGARSRGGRVARHGVAIDRECGFGRSTGFATGGRRSVTIARRVRQGRPGGGDERERGDEQCNNSRSLHLSFSHVPPNWASAFRQVLVVTGESKRRP